LQKSGLLPTACGKWLEMPGCDHCAGYTQTFPIKNAANWQPEKSPVQESDFLSLFVRPIEKAGMPYLVAGSVGVMHYSEPRLTLVVDIPSQITPKQIPSLLAHSKILFNFSL
jgi:hypothetical protein